MKIGGFATLISGVIAMSMAWQGYGVWALAAQTLAASTVTTILLWSFNDWRPALVFSRASARRLFGFGGYLLASGLLETVYARIYTLLIGKFYGVREVGFYNRADSTQQLPVGVLTGILSRVAFPIFSAAAHDRARLRRGVQLAVRGMMLLNVPMMLGLAALAEPAILTLFGERWLPSAPVLQVLCLSGILWPLHVINLNVLMAQGHSHLFFRLELIKKLLGLTLVIIGSWYGMMGIAWSHFILNILAFGINAHYSKRFLDYGAAAQTRDFLPVLGISALMAMCVMGAGRLLPLRPELLLAVLVMLGVLIFIGLSSALRLIALHDVIDLIKRRKLVVHPS